MYWDSYMYVRAGSVLAASLSECLKCPIWPLLQPNWPHVTANFVLGNLGNGRSYGFIKYSSWCTGIREHWLSAGSTIYSCQIA